MTKVHPTLLSRLVREGRHTIEEQCEAYAKAARDMGEDATLSIRQINRWMDGEVGRPRPVSRRVAERLWGHPFEVLVGPPDGAGRSAVFPSPRPPLPDASPAVSGWFGPLSADRNVRVAICGSRSAGTDDGAIDDAIRELGRLLINRQCQVDHGPLGVGIEIMTYVADHYQPPGLQAAVGVFGRLNVVRNADFVIVIGGGQGTTDEVDLAISMGKPVFPFVASGGAARRCYERMAAAVGLRASVPEPIFSALGSCTSAEEFARTVEQIFSDSGGGPGE